jgi:hypothetical protein
MPALYNQLSKDLKIAAEMVFATVIVAVEASALFGVMYYVTH